jgi:hypothetical protein
VRAAPMNNAPGSERRSRALCAAPTRRGSLWQESGAGRLWSWHPPLLFTFSYTYPFTFSHTVVYVYVYCCAVNVYASFTPSCFHVEFDRTCLLIVIVIAIAVVIVSP